MSRRITEDRVKKLSGVVGVPILIGIIALIVTLGAGEVTDYYYTEFCEGSIEDPCIVILNMTMEETVFVYPFEDNKYILGTNDSLEDLHMYRSWGNGWREIPLDRTCTGTWCGGLSRQDVKYSFAFREGRNYTIKFEGFKTDPLQEVAWSFNPKGVWRAKKPKLNMLNCANQELVNTTYVKTPYNFSFNGTSEIWFNKTKVETPYVGCVVDGNIYLDKVKINPEGYVCSIYMNDTLECDKFGDSNADGKCNMNGGETCLIRRYLNKHKYFESYTNSDVPDKEPKKDKKSKSVKNE